MEFGFYVPNGGPMANPKDIETIVRRGEDMGYTLLAVPDHIIIPKAIGSRYPYSASGKFASAAEEGDCLEPLAMLAFLASCSTKARLLTSVLVIPYRHPVFTAKFIATVDVLSQGRAVLGCGAGWMEEEFTPVGAPPFDERGKVTDEYIAAFKELWTKDDPHFEGTYASFSNIFCAPKPIQKPHPPIWIGGESGPAIRRAARHGNGWFPIGCNPRHPLNTIKRLESALDKLRRSAEDIDRDPSEIDLAYWSVWPSDQTPLEIEDGTRHMLTGTTDDLITDVVAFRELGFRHLVFNFLGASVQQTLENMERFAQEVAPSVTS